MKIAIAQAQLALGDISLNTRKVCQEIQKTPADTDFILFPEGGVFGYPPTDFLFSEKLLEASLQACGKIQKASPKHLKVLIGGFRKEKGHLYNGCFLLEKDKKIQFFKKSFLSDKEVFSESRYFEQGDLKDNYYLWNKKRIQILICEDIFHQPSFKKPAYIFCINSSPFHSNKSEIRLKALKNLVKKYSCPIVYVNRVGGQGELIFDGGSLALNSEGRCIFQAPYFKPCLETVDMSQKPCKKIKIDPLEKKKQALLLGLKDFLKQTNFKQVHLGLSGGLDSALVAYLACLALGEKNVQAFFLPSKYTRKLSFKIVKELQKKLGFSLKIQNIEALNTSFLKEFSKNFALKKSLTKQNIQARLRNLYLMAYANETKSLLLSTGNKSELAQGYSTLYGDLGGGLLPLGDLFKTELYELVNYINKTQDIFPKYLITRPPSAELCKDQKDSDDLPPYPVLDPILKKLMKNQQAKGPLEKEIERRLRESEFKRKQAPPILKISDPSFSSDWKFPIAHRFFS